MTDVMSLPEHVARHHADTTHRVLRCGDTSCAAVPDAQFVGLVSKETVVPAPLTRAWMEAHCVHTTNWSPTRNATEDIETIMCAHILKLAHIAPPRRRRAGGGAVPATASPAAATSVIAPG
jgi:hypothetical protein